MLWEGELSNDILTKANFGYVFFVCLVLMLLLNLDFLENGDIKSWYHFDV